MSYCARYLYHTGLSCRQNIIKSCVKHVRTYSMRYIIVKWYNLLKYKHLSWRTWSSSWWHHQSVNQCVMLVNCFLIYPTMQYRNKDPIAFYEHVFAIGLYYGIYKIFCGMLDTWIEGKPGRCFLFHDHSSLSMNGNEFPKKLVCSWSDLFDVGRLLKFKNGVTDLTSATILLSIDIMQSLLTEISNRANCNSHKPIKTC